MVRFYSTIALVCVFLCISYTSAYTQVGNKIIDPNGKEVLIRGVDRPSFEWNSRGENANAQDYILMAGWGANVVRIALNQDYWLQGSGTYSSSYQSTIDQQVQWAKAAGMGVILDLHWSDKGDLHISGGANQQIMADVNSITFWGQVASKYKSDPWVMFELYNEPHDVSPSVWRDGGSAGGFQIAGMQQLFNAVRLAGAQNLVIVNGLDWAYNLQQVYPAYKITGTNIAYGTHPYNFEGKKKDNWPSGFGFVTKDYPVIMTEFGQYCANDGYVAQLMEYAQNNGIHWTAWAWYVGGCSFPSIISDWSGRVESVIGTVVKQYMKMTPGVGSTPAPNSPTAKPPSAGATSAPVVVPPATTAQVIFDDSFQNGWQSWSWAPVNFGITNPVKSGSKAASMVLANNGGLYLHNDVSFFAGKYSAIQFYLNGGSSGIVQLDLFPYDASGNPFGQRITISTSTNTWALQTIPLTQLGLASTVSVSGFVLQFNGADNGNVIFVDQIQLVPAGVSATPTTTPTSAPHPATVAPTPKPATTEAPATQQPTTRPPATPQPTTPATPQPTTPATPQPTTPATPQPTTPTNPGNADCNTVCDASCIVIDQTAGGSWGSPVVYQYGVNIQNNCKTKSLKSLTLFATSWDPAGFWNAQTNGNQVTITLAYNAILPNTANTNFGYQNKGGKATFQVSDFLFA